MLTIPEVFDFLNSTVVTPELLRIVGLDGVSTVPPHEYLYQNIWELRYDAQRLREMYERGHTFILLSSNVAPKIKQLVEGLESKHLMPGQAHVYFGKEGSQSFPKHADEPENYIYQCVGESKFTLYNETAPSGGLYPLAETTTDFSKILKPGDVVYIPSKRLHYLEPLTTRLSVSVPLVPDKAYCNLA